jgi:hypothetical protein
MRPVAYGPHWPRLPPPASPAPIGLTCPHGKEEGSALILGIGLRLWQSALSFPSLSFVYNSIVFPSLWIVRQFIFLSSSPSSSRVNTSAKLSGGGGEKRIFPSQLFPGPLCLRLLRILCCAPPPTQLPQRCHLPTVIAISPHGCPCLLRIRQFCLHSRQQCG